MQSQAKVRQLVKEGRLEFLNGGWVASDEACPTFEDLIMNILTGNSFLMREFGVQPKVAWHCDPFGHSGVTVDLFAKMGYETLFFSRVDDDEKVWRKNNQLMEFVWQPVYETPEGPIKSKHSLFTHVMHA